MCSASWKSAANLFLDLMRCVESLQAIPHGSMCMSFKNVRLNRNQEKRFTGRPGKLVVVLWCEKQKAEGARESGRYGPARGQFQLEKQSRMDRGEDKSFLVRENT